jgi:hypothetical protein
VKKAPLIVIHPQAHATLVLGLWRSQEFLRASLPTASLAQPQAAPLLLESLSLWYQRQVRVVLSADSDLISSRLAISDGFGGGRRSEHYAVEVWPHDSELRGRQLGGVADFGSLYQLATGRPR